VFTPNSTLFRSRRKQRRARLAGTHEHEQTRDKGVASSCEQKISARHSDEENHLGGQWRDRGTAAAKMNQADVKIEKAARETEIGSTLCWVEQENDAKNRILKIFPAWKSSQELSKKWIWGGVALAAIATKQEVNKILHSGKNRAARADQRVLARNPRAEHCGVSQAAGRTKEEQGIQELEKWHQGSSTQQKRRQTVETKRSSKIKTAEYNWDPKKWFFLTQTRMIVHRPPSLICLLKMKSKTWHNNATLEIVK
jgi:hypothetical protein